MCVMWYNLHDVYVCCCGVYIYVWCLHVMCIVIHYTVCMICMCGIIYVCCVILYVLGDCLYHLACICVRYFVWYISHICAYVACI